ncbi:hypothetical protein [Ottowia sp.]|uniref:hypothetical protein n=1 Tax=Ottowia sp. TaxID=1898956 RepID=UPI002CE189DF|nr:hypothetical protein [Ottowia sp.]MCP5256406.1 hypothetical protein [Burkholderiaceae bacterium]HRW72200.1 hypothetical protein [Ottowia sp.]
MAKYSVKFANEQKRESVVITIYAASESEAEKLALQEVNRSTLQYHEKDIVTIRKSEFYDSESYFDLADAISDVKFAGRHLGVTESAKEVSKLIGKSLFNGGIFTGKAATEIIRCSPSIISSMVENKLNQNKEKGDPDQRKKLEEYTRNNKGKRLWKNSKLD